MIHMAEIAKGLHILLNRKSRDSACDDSALFERLVAAHQDRLYRVAYRMAGSVDAAQDLMQDALLEAYRAFGNFKKGTYFDRWLFRIMTRTFIDSKRSKKHIATLSLDASALDNGENGAGFEISDSTNDPQAIISSSIYDEPIQNALDKLPPDYRLTIILADVEELSYEEIAQVMNCPIGTVRSRLNRARAQMKTSLKNAGYIAANL
jgi:RNA polymerase sigma-70 factor (ECF subfamily)